MESILKLKPDQAIRKVIDPVFIIDRALITDKVTDRALITDSNKKIDKVSNLMVSNSLHSYFKKIGLALRIHLIPQFNKPLYQTPMT